MIDCLILLHKLNVAFQFHHSRDELLADSANTALDMYNTRIGLVNRKNTIDFTLAIKLHKCSAKAFQYIRSYGGQRMNNTCQQNTEVDIVYRPAYVKRNDTGPSNCMPSQEQQQRHLSYFSLYQFEISSLTPSDSLVYPISITTYMLYFISLTTSNCNNNNNNNAVFIHKCTITL